MPRIDPTTGCEVMTFFEFIGEEAKNKGCDPADIITNIHEELDNDAQQMEDYYSKPKNALEAILSLAKEDFEAYDPKYDIYGPPHIPKQILKVLEITCRCGFSTSNTHFIARVICEDDKERIVEFCYQHWYGTIEEPEEEDMSLTWYETIGDWNKEKELRKRPKSKNKSILDLKR